MAASTNYGLPRPPDENGAGLPNWMDPKGQYGKITVLSLKAANDVALPDNHPFVVGKSIQDAVGEIYSATTEAKGSKYILKVRNEAQVAKLLEMKKLITGMPIEVTQHPTLNFCRCVVYCPEASKMTKEELLAELAQQGVTDVRRFTRMVNGVKYNTPSVVLTFKGTCFPQHVKFGALRVETRVYYPPPMLCYGCLQYGHTKARCNGTPRCQKCSANDHSADECSGALYCFHCKKEHRPVDRKCSVYRMEEEIVRIKVERGLSHLDAQKLYESRTGNKSYANVIKQNIEDEKDKEIASLKHEIAALRKQPNIVVREDDAKDKEIASLRKEVAALQRQLSEVISELKNYAKAKCQCQAAEEPKKDQRNKRPKDISPEIVPDLRQPPPKKVSGEKYTITASAGENQPTNTDEVMDYGSDSEVIIINRKGKKKQPRLPHDGPPSSNQ